MKIIFGLGLILLGVFCLCYVGIYLMFIGGIVQVIDAIKSTPVPSYDIAFGAARIIFASFVGWLSAILPISFGLALLKD